MYRAALILLLTAFISNPGLASQITPEIPASYRKFINFDQLDPASFLSTDVFVIDPRNTLINRGENSDRVSFTSFFQSSNVTDIPCFLVHYGCGSTAYRIPAFLNSEVGRIIRLSNLADNHPVLKAKNGVMLDLYYKNLPTDLMALLQKVRETRPQTSRLVFFTQDWELLNVLGRQRYANPVLGCYRMIPSEVDCIHSARYTLAGEEQLQWIFNEDTSQLAQRFLQDPSILMRTFYKPFENGKTLDLFDLLKELKKEQALIEVFSNLNETHDVILQLAQLLSKGYDSSWYTSGGLYIDTLKTLREFYDQNIWDDLYSALCDLLYDYPKMQPKDRLHLAQKLARYGPDFLKEMANSSSTRLSMLEKRALEDIPQGKEISTSMSMIAVSKLIYWINDLNPNTDLTPFDVLLFIESMQGQPDDSQQVAIWLVEYAACKDKLDYLYEDLKERARGINGTTNSAAFDELCLPILKLIEATNLKLEKSDVFHYMDRLAGTLDELYLWFSNKHSVQLDRCKRRYEVLCGVKNELLDYTLIKTKIFINKIMKHVSLDTYKYSSFALSLLESCVKCSQQEDVNLHYQVLDRCFGLHPYSDFSETLYNFKQIPMANLTILMQMFQIITSDDRGRIHINDLLPFLREAGKPNKEQMQEVYDEFIARLEKQKSQPAKDPNVYNMNEIDSSVRGFWKVLREYNSKHMLG